jgi:hypothetical protein
MCDLFLLTLSYLRTYATARESQLGESLARGTGETLKETSYQHKPTFRSNVAEEGTIQAIF